MGFSLLFTHYLPSHRSFLIDRLGRRALFFIGAIGQGVAMTITFACLIPDDGNDKQAGKGAAFGIFLFIAFFALTILPLP